MTRGHGKLNLTYGKAPYLAYRIISLKCCICVLAPEAICSRIYTLWEPAHIRYVSNYNHQTLDMYTFTIAFVSSSSFVYQGTGVPVVLCGSKLLEKQIMEDVGMIERTDDSSTIFMQYILFAIFIAALGYFLARILF